METDEMTKKIKKLTRWLVWSLLVVVAPVGHASSEDVAEATRKASQHYLELETSLQYDALREVYAPDVQFFDPTAEIFPGPISQGALRGADTIIEMQKGWGLAEVDFEIRSSFVVGEYALHRGTFKARFENSEKWFPIPFITIHRIQDGRLTERLDFGEYIESLGMGDDYDSNTAQTRDVADRYLQAYLEGDLGIQGGLVAPDIQFQDPTAKVFGPPSGQLFQGSEELLHRRIQIYANIAAFGLEVEESFVANHHAVYMGTTTYTLSEGLRFAQPAVLVIEVRDGKVTRHWDFVDYSVGPLAD